MPYSVFSSLALVKLLEINKKKENQFAQWVVVVRKIN